MSEDTRPKCSLDDTKAGTAAFDDALTTLREYLEENPNMPDKRRQTLEMNATALSRIVMRANAIIGSMTRVVDET